MNLSRPGLVFGAALLGSVAAFTVACGDDDTNDTPTSSSSGDAGTSGSADPDGGGARPQYAFQSLVSGVGTQATYINILDSLDTQANLTNTTAREFPGYAPAMAVDGKIFVNAGEGPTVTRYAVSADKTWTEEQSASFASYSSTSLTAHIVVSGTQAYAPFDAVSLLRWDPSTLAFGAEVADPTAVPINKDGLVVQRGYSRPTVGNFAFQPFYWASPDFSTVGKTSQIGILDPATDSWVATPEVACPHMHITTTDDQNNVYFSPGVFSIGPAVVDATFPRNCMVRIKAGETTIDPTFNVKFADLTEGREGSNFFYIGNNIGFFQVYHEELDTPAVAGDAKAIANQSTKYHIWTLDLNTMKAAPMQGIDYGGGQYITVKLDGRTFLAQPAPDYSSTAVFEITAAGAAEKRFDVQGWMFNMFKVR